MYTSIYTGHDTYVQYICHNQFIGIQVKVGRYLLFYIKLQNYKLTTQVNDSVLYCWNVPIMLPQTNPCYSRCHSLARVPYDAQYGMICS